MQMRWVPAWLILMNEFSLRALDRASLNAIFEISVTGNLDVEVIAGSRIIFALAEHTLCAARISLESVQRIISFLSLLVSH